MEPTVRSFSADFEPLRLIERFPQSYPGLLESGAAASAAAGGTARHPALLTGARFDVLPFASGEILKLDARGILSGPHADAGGFVTALERWWRSLQTEESAASLPYSGGWFVYLSYELAAEIESCLHLPAAGDPIVALAVRTPAAWIRDRLLGRAWLVAEPGYGGLLDEFEERALTLASPAGPPLTPARVEMHEEEPVLFLNAVGRALDYVAAGDVYQVNLSRRWQSHAVPGPQALAASSLYARLRATNPSPFAGLLQHEGFWVLSSSPERLLSIRGGVVSTRPIAGTRPRGATPARDAALVRSLLENDKERAEHVMLIDLERNDLGRICKGGSVQVDEYMSVETYAHVHHIVSNVRGHLNEDATPLSAIRALFPGGTITGCPKIRCMQIIGELEDVGRGAYTGSLGYLNRDGSCDFNILIRTITAQDGVYSFRAGAGIVADSNAAQELAETRAKAEGLLRAFLH